MADPANEGVPTTGCPRIVGEEQSRDVLAVERVAQRLRKGEDGAGRAGVERIERGGANGAPGSKSRPRTAATSRHVPGRERVPRSRR